MSNKFWHTPQSRSIGFFSDTKVIFEVLEFGTRNSFFSKSSLKENLSERIVGVSFLKEISETGIENLLRELKTFGWIKNIEKLSEDMNYSGGIITSDMIANLYIITNEGKRILSALKNSPYSFQREMLTNLHKMYSIPGWFVQRLWDLNTSGQGQIVIPSPLKSWNPSNRNWEDKKLNSEFESQIIDAYNHTQRIAPGCFNIESHIWMDLVREKWNRMGSYRRNAKEGKRSVKKYTPRKRLALAMKEASVEFMFGNINPKSGSKDFDSNKSPLLPRTFLAWCVRLEELGLINYTDFNPRISGRLIYPVSLFRLNSNSSNFLTYPEIINLENKVLSVFNPEWFNIKDKFMETLFEQYQYIYIKVRSMYISAQDLRDEVCRVLRLNYAKFNDFLENAIADSQAGSTNYRIAIETDIREDQRSAYQILRRPVYVSEKLVTLVAITKK